MKTFVANLYNPHELTKEELIENFVVRHRVFGKLFKEIKSSDMTHPEQHYLIVGQRGMGKTTLLLRLCYEIENDAELNTWLIPVVLKEEAHYGIGQLSQLWETVAREMENRDKSFSGLSAQMEDKYNENTDYERICFDMLENALETESKKIILFIDNMGEMFKNFSDMECRRLREILMNCPYLRIIGASAMVLE
ncbi:AAA family ATPase, partial [Desulfobacterales bacterium HSG2]|nr:AAA family ATPase [Desulfobacterales bacterium HSG2]